MNNGGLVNYLHYTNIWPLKTKTIKELEKKGNKIIVVEHNMTGQFAALLKGAGINIDDTWLKYDGRRFYREEMEAKITALVRKENMWYNSLIWMLPKKIFRKR
jgi:2-oxoglutarate ferredoxin oxidoreductase subunit alpha